MAELHDQPYGEQVEALDVVTTLQRQAQSGGLPLVEHRNAFTGEQGNDGFSFQHLRLQEFLAARHIARSEASIKAVVSQIPDEKIGWWNAVLQLVFDLVAPDRLLAVLQMVLQDRSEAARVQVFHGAGNSGNLSVVQTILDMDMDINVLTLYIDILTLFIDICSDIYTRPRLKTLDSS